jgi:hypothetical protein
MRCERWSAAALGCAWLFGSATAFAQPPAPPPAASGASTNPAPSAPSASEARAEARFREGSEAFDHGRVDEACAAFADSLRAFATLGTLLNLALCHEKQGKTASAWAEFVHAAAWANEPAQRDRREFARQHASRLERGLPRLRIEVTDGEPQTMTLSLDGEALSGARLALPLFVDPGNHTVSAAAPGFQSASVSVTAVTVASGEAQVVTIPRLLEMHDALVLPARPQEPPPTRGPDTRSLVGYAVGGAGLVAVAVGIGFGADAISRTGALGAKCAAGCDAGPAKTSEIVSLVTLGVGAVGLAAGAWLVFGPRRASSPAVALVVGPSAAPGGAGLALDGTW